MDVTRGSVAVLPAPSSLGSGVGGWPALLTALRRAQTDEIVRAVVLTLAGAPEGGQVQPDFEVARAACEEVMATDMPVVAAVEGSADGWLLALCACCDLVVAGRDAVFGGEPLEPEAACAVWTYWLPPRLAKEVAFGAGRLSAQRALAAGFVNEVVEQGSAERRAVELAAAVIRIPADVLAVKKLANNQNLALESFPAALRLAADYSLLALRASGH